MSNSNIVQQNEEKICSTCLNPISPRRHFQNPKPRFWVPVPSLVFIYLVFIYCLQQPVQYKHVVKEVPIEIKKFVPEVVTTGCVNSFGTAVPCFIAGEARKRRSADEAPAATVALAHPFAYAGYAHPYAHAGYAHAGYAHAGYAHPYAYAPTVLEPKTVEIEVPTPVYKEVEVKVPLGPACQNHLGFPVPCL